MARPALPVGACTVDRDGYVRIKVGDHPLARAGWVRFHRAVLYDLIGPGEHACWRCGGRVAWGAGLEVDHVDHDRQNNEPENLRPACRACQNRGRPNSLRKNGGGAVSGVLHALLAEMRDDPAAAAELRLELGAGPAVYTPKTLAAELGVTPRAVRGAIERGDLAAVRSGRGWVIAAEAVAAWASSPARTRRRATPRKSRPMGDAIAGLDKGKC